MYIYRFIGKSEEQLPQKTVGRQLADCHLPLFTKIFCQQSADCWQHVGNLLARCQLKTRQIPEKPQLAGKKIGYRCEMKLSHLSPPYFGFLGTKPLTIPLHHPRSQEAKNLFTAASCSFFF